MNPKITIRAGNAIQIFGHADEKNGTPIEVPVGTIFAILLLLALAGCSDVQRSPTGEPNFGTRLSYAQAAAQALDSWEGERGRFGVINVLDTGSMRPVLDGGDILLYDRDGWDNVQVGSIVLFRRGQDIVAHEVYEIRGTQLYTRGRNSGRDAGFVSPSTFIGLVIANFYGEP